MKYENMGSLIKEIRKEKNMTQKDLADQLNITDKAVSKWERGISYPDINTIPELSKLLGLSVEELMELKKDDEVNEENLLDKVGEISNIVFRAVGMAMGIAVLVLSILNKIEVRDGMTLLAIGLACIGIVQMSELNKK